MNNFLCGRCLWYWLLFTRWDRHEEAAHLGINRRHLSCFLLCPECACVSFPHQSIKQHARGCQRKPAVRNWMAVAHIWMTPLLGQSSSIILWGTLEASCPLCPKYKICACLDVQDFKVEGFESPIHSWTSKENDKFHIWVDKDFQTVWWERGLFHATFYSVSNLRNICKYSLGIKGCYELRWIVGFNLAIFPADWHQCLWFHGHFPALAHHTVSADRASFCLVLFHELPLGNLIVISFPPWGPSKSDTGKLDFISSLHEYLK